MIPNYFSNVPLTKKQRLAHALRMAQAHIAMMCGTETAIEAPKSQSQYLYVKNQIESLKTALNNEK